MKRSRVIHATFFIAAVVTMLASPNRTVVAQTAAEASTPKLQLEPCRLPGWSEDVRCGRYEVYENRQSNTGRKISLRVVVAPAAIDKPASDPIFYFAGGPGGSAVDTLQKAGKLYLSTLRKNRDIVFVDQRGTGGSNPLSCNLYRDAIDVKAYFGPLFSADRLRECKSELEKVADLTLYSTPTAMEDIDDVRAALGYDKINLYGGSYGSTAALAYLRQYPQHVRAVLVVGVAPPDAKLPLPFTRGVQHALDRLFTDCQADEKCRNAFPKLKSDFESIVKDLEKEPASFELPGSTSASKLTMNKDTFREFVRTMLYSPEYSRWMPFMIHHAAEGDFRPFATIGLQVFRGIDGLIARGMHFSVVCAEDLAFVSDADAQRELTGAFYGTYRLKAYRDACSIWPTAKIPASFATPVTSDVPVLMISGELDPVTPPSLAAEAVRHLPNGRQILARNLAHSFSNSCIDNISAEFIARASAKDLDASCVDQLRRPSFITDETLTGKQSESAKESSSASPKGVRQERWEGVLDVGTAKLRLVLRLSIRADGELTGELDSPDQRANNLEIDSVSRKDSTLRFEMTLRNAVYEGKISSDGSEVVGEWQQSGRRWPLTFRRE
jgi:pimeloyl-ACP methyl ester carboxylesterase